MVSQVHVYSERRCAHFLSCQFPVGLKLVQQSTLSEDGAPEILSAFECDLACNPFARGLLLEWSRGERGN